MAAIPWSIFVRAVVAQTLDYWIDHGGLGIFEASGTSDPVIGGKAVMVFNRPGEAPSSTRDYIDVGTYWVHTDAGNYGATWDSGDRAAVTALLKAFWATMKLSYGNTTTLDSIRHYDVEIGVPPPHPVKQVDSVAVAGTLGGSFALPPQVASTVTLRTPSRRHWGRFYMPAPSYTMLDGTNNSKAGRFSQTFVDGLANAVGAMFESAIADGTVAPAVYTPSAAGFLAVLAVEVDDVPDVQRRRRFATTGYRKILEA